MGSLSISNMNGNGYHGNGICGNGTLVNGKNHDQAQRKSCWYEEEIEDNLRWSFALNR